MTVLTYEMVRSLFKKGYDTWEIAAYFGVSEALIYNYGWYTRAKNQDTEAQPPKREARR